MLNVESPELTVDKDRGDETGDLCSGIPKLNAEKWFGVYGGSVLALSMDDPELDDKLFNCTARSFGFLPIPEGSVLKNSLFGRVDVQRLCGGGCKEKAPRDKARLALSLFTDGWSVIVGCRSVRILRSMRRSLGFTRPEWGKLVVRTTGTETEGLSGLFGRNILKRLRMLVNDSSLVSRSCCLSKSTEAASDPERGRVDEVNKPLNADSPLAPVLWDAAE